VPDWKEWAFTGGSCQIHQGKQVTGEDTHHPASSTASSWALQTPLAGLKWLPLQSPFFTANDTLPLTVVSPLHTLMIHGAL